MAKKSAKRPKIGRRKLPSEGTPSPETPVREWPRVEVFSQGPAATSRKSVADKFGEAFASKASDRLCQALSTMQPPAKRRGLRAGLESLAPQPRPAILEFDAPMAAEAEVRKRAVLLARSEKSVPQPLLVLARQHTLRDHFAKQIAPITAHLERASRPLFPAGLEAMASPTVPSQVVEVCWLNGTARAFVDPKALSDIASDKSLKQIDLPRPLRAEIDATGVVLCAPQFRKKFSLTGEHLIIAVIDGEVDVHHPGLEGRVTQKGNYTKERWGSPSPHGTAVAGIIASADRKFTGMAPGVTIANYKVLATDDSLNSDDFGGSLAIQQALEDGAQIANCSWGSGPAGDGTSREAVACNTAWGLGLILVKSAGNAGPSGSTLTTPADADGIIVVGATDRKGKAVQDYSSRGPAGEKKRPHLVAPGGTFDEGIHSCVPGGEFGDAGAGTSFAAPHVSGLAALLLAQDPSLQPEKIREKLVSLCKPLKGEEADAQGAGFLSLKSVK